jgi:hypothetical protein
LDDAGLFRLPVGEGEEMRTMIEMAHEVYGEHTFWTEAQLLRLKAFADLVRADEREACAKVCEAVHTGEYDTPEFWREGVAYTCAAAIRARGNT